MITTQDLKELGVPLYTEDVEAIAVELRKRHDQATLERLLSVEDRVASLLGQALELFENEAPELNPEEVELAHHVSVAAMLCFRAAVDGHQAG